MSDTGNAATPQPLRFDAGAGPHVAMLDRSELAPGSVLGDYRIERLLGRGGMGAVYAAEQIADGRLVALKLLSVDLREIDARDRFLREGRSAAAVNHPNTVYVYRAEEIDGVPAICMELVADGTLEEHVKARGPLPANEVLEYALHMIEGLAAAHDVGLLHRDVKPSNCFVGDDGTLKIGDFGLSKPSNADEQLRLTKTGVFMGTPVYSSPEQLLGDHLDLRSDIYAVGLTLYYALTGTLPYPSGSMMQVIASVVNGAPVPIATHRPDVAANVETLVMKAMARQPADRFQTYDEFRDAVAAVRGASIAAATPNDRIRAWMIDATIVEVASLIVAHTLEAIRGHRVVADLGFLDITITLLLCTALIAFPEGLRGFSPGKWLIGIRVVGPDSGPPGLTRAVGRSAGLWSSYLVSATAYLIWPNLGIAFLAYVLARAVILATARRATGWLTMYDRLTRTRVVRQAPPPLRRRRASQASSRPMSESGRRVGPYVIVDEGATPTGMLPAWDPALRRPVWIAMGEADGHVSNARRDVTRTTRLRWLGSSGDQEAHWNSYSAPGGESFLHRIQRSISWDDAQGWIEDLTDELIAAEADGTLPVMPGVDALWIGGNGALLIEDTNPAAVEPNATLRRARDLAAELITQLRESDQWPAGVPAFATAALDAASDAANPELARAAIFATQGKAIAFTRRRRAWMLLAQCAIVVAFPLFAGAFQFVQTYTDRDGSRLDWLVSYVGNDSANAAPYQAGRGAGRALGRLVVPARRQRSQAAQDSLLRNRRLASTYISAVLGSRARDWTHRPFGMSQSRVRRAAELADRFASASAADVREARFLVDTVWRGVPPGQGSVKTLGVTVAIAVMLLLFAGVASVGFALLLRRGPVMRLFDAELVLADGRIAGRPRVALRQFITYAPIAVVSLAALITTIGLANGEPVGQAWEAFVGALVVAWGAYLWHAARSPTQSVADRLAGTYLVPT